MIVIQEVVLSHRTHVGQETFANLHLELIERHALPLGRGLHDLGVNRVLIMVVGDVKADRRPRSVAVKVVVHPALDVDNQGHRHRDEIQDAAQPTLDMVFQREDGALGVPGCEQRRVVGGQNALELFIAADSGASQVSRLVGHGGPFAFCAEERTRPMGAAGRESRHASPTGIVDDKCAMCPSAFGRPRSRSRGSQHGR